MKKLFSVLLISILLICAVGMTSCEMPWASTTTGEQPHVHAFTDTVVDPTCVNEGYTEHKCAECGYVMQDTFIPADGKSHEYQLSDRLEPGCTTAGYEKTACVHCGDEIVTELEAEHKLGSWQVIVKPSCTTAGEERSYCSVCTYYESRKLDAAHEYDERLDVVVEPTCDTEGYTEHTCYVCKHTYKDSFKGALGHEWIEHLDQIDNDEWVTVVKGSCHVRGEEMRQCEICDFVERKYVGYVHDLETLVTDPTCTTQGYTTTHCVLCDYAVVSDYVDPAHTMGNWETYLAPSCKMEGIERRYCEIEGCGYFENRKVAPQHVYDNHKTVAPGEFTSGYEEHSCDCGLSYRDNYVSAKGTEGLIYELHNIWNSETGRYEDYYEVVGLDEACEADMICIPFEYNGLPVKVIGYKAFYDNDNITRIYLTRNITDIGISAFWNCDNLVAFEYDGYWSEWNEINMGESWNLGLQSHEVICSDYTDRVIVKVEDEEIDENK